jgi:hypothetical protein
MAVGADHNTLFDLFSNYINGVTASYKSGYFSPLRAFYMIKLKYDWVRFSTFDTRMSRKVVPDVGATLYHLGLPVLYHVGYVGFFVSLVPTVFLLVLALTAGSLPYPCCLPAPVKLLHCLFLKAMVADLHVHPNPLLPYASFASGMVSEKKKGGLG